MAARSQDAPALLRQDSATGILVDRMKRGDRSALAELYDQTSAILYGMMLRILSDPADAQALLMEAYERAWSQIHRFNQDRSPGLLPWLVLLARSVALEWPGRKPVTAHAGASDQAILERAFFDGVVEGDLRGALIRLRLAARERKEGA